MDVKEYLKRSTPDGEPASHAEIATWVCPHCDHPFGLVAAEHSKTWMLPKSEGLGMFLGPLITCPLCEKEIMFDDSGAFQDEVEE